MSSMELPMEEKDLPSTTTDSEEPSKNKCSFYSWYCGVKKWCIKEYGRPQDESSEALVHSILLYIGTWVTVYAMNIIQTLYYTDEWFWNGSKAFGRKGALDLCLSGESILKAFPKTVSESLSSDTGVTNVLIGSYLTFTALMLLASKIGNPSAFPMASGHFGTIFNTLRMIAPVIATFFIPRVAIVGDKALVSSGSVIINDSHMEFATLTFALSPLFEIISGILEVIYFFTHKPIGDNYIPFHESKNERGQKRRRGLAIIYKSLWVALTLLRIAVAIFIISYLVWAFLGLDRSTKGATTDACGALRVIKTYILEKCMVGLIGGLYLILSVTQMCESSGRRISSLFYILPLLVFALIEVGKHFSTFDQTNNMEKNYLRLLNIPESGWWNDDDPLLVNFFRINPEAEQIVANCTAILDVATVSDNCFQVP